MPDPKEYDPKEYLDMNEAMHLSSLSGSTLRRLIRDRLMTSIMVRRLLIHRQSLLDYLKLRET